MDEDCHFFKNISLNKKHGRYVVTLPWKRLQPPCDQFDNFNACLTRPYNLRTHLRKDECLLREYECTFQLQMESGIIEQVTREG